MSMMSLCSSQFAASPACVALSRIGIPRPYPLPAPGSFGLVERFYGRASASSERRPAVVHAAKGKKRATTVDRWTRDSKKKNDDLAGAVGNEAPIPAAPKPSPAPAAPKPSPAAAAPKPSPAPAAPKPSPAAAAPKPSPAPAAPKPSPAAATPKPSPAPAAPKPSPAPTTTFVAVDPAKWEEFAARVSGEWDGYSACFNMFGEPLELPENVVPDAFREWKREVHDWQTQCPTLAHPENGRLWYKVMKLHPTVGCEADAATVYSIEERDAPGDATALAYHSSGCYTSVWPGKSFTTKKMTREEDEVEVEQCLVHDKTRIRVFQKLGARRHILICREAWEGPFRNGESLGGCAAATATFATEKKLDAKDILGKWNSEIYTLKDLQPEQGYTSRELIHSGSEVVERTWSNTFLYGWFPKDTWTLLLKTESGGTTIETGWLPEPDVMIVTKCEIGSSGDLKEASLRVEKRISSEVAPVDVSAEDLEELLTE